MALKQQVTPADIGDHPGTGSDVAGGTGGAAAAHRPVVSTGNPRRARSSAADTSVADLAAESGRMAAEAGALAHRIMTGS